MKRPTPGLELYPIPAINFNRKFKQFQGIPRKTAEQRGFSLLFSEWIHRLTVSPNASFLPHKLYRFHQISPDRENPTVLPESSGILPNLVSCKQFLQHNPAPGHPYSTSIRFRFRGAVTSAVIIVVDARSPVPRPVASSQKQNHCQQRQVEDCQIYGDVRGQRLREVV